MYNLPETKQPAAAQAGEVILVASGDLRLSANVMCWMPASTCARISARTTSAGMTRNWPSYTGTMGQWRQRCLQPRVESVDPATRRVPSGICSDAYRLGGARPLRSGWMNSRRGSRLRFSDTAGRTAAPVKAIRTSDSSNSGPRASSTGSPTAARAYVRSRSPRRSRSSRCA